MEDFITQNGLIGLICAMALQGLKKWPKVTSLGTDKEFEWRNRIASIFTAILATGLIHYEWHFDAHTGAFDLAVSGNLHTIGSAAWEVVKQWSTQHASYKAFVVLPELLGNIYVVMKRLEVGQIVEQQRATLPPLLPPPARRQP